MSDIDDLPYEVHTGRELVLWYEDWQTNAWIEMLLASPTRCSWLLTSAMLPGVSPSHNQA